MPLPPPAAAFGKLRDRLRGLVLHELAHVVADHAHADLLVEDLLQLFGQRDVLHRHAFELQADLGELRAPAAVVSASANSIWLAARSRNGMPLAAIALLMFCSTRPRSWPSRSGHACRCRGCPRSRCGTAWGRRCGSVVAEGAQAHGAEVLVADGDRLRRAPLLVDLLARAEEIDVALERGLEQLVPVLQVGEDRQGLRGELVHAGAEHVGHLALVDEHRHLRFAHGERGAVLDFHVRHREAPGQRAVAGLGPLDDVDELFLDEVHQGHGRCLRDERSGNHTPAGRRFATAAHGGAQAPSGTGYHGVGWVLTAEAAAAMGGVAVEALAGADAAEAGGRGAPGGGPAWPFCTAAMSSGVGDWPSSQ